MAVGGFLALLDDIAVLMRQTAAQGHNVVALAGKAGGSVVPVLGDDVAVTPGMVTGIEPKRELPVIGKIFKGSIKNKAWLIPSAVLLSVFAPWAIKPLLMAGGVYLCHEGMEKMAEGLGRGHVDNT